MLLYMFVYVIIYHRTLHSFPTRRSSDLGDRGADAQVIDAGDEHDVARRGRLDRQALQSGKTKQLSDFGPGPGLTAVKDRSEEHTSELQSRFDLVCRLLLE